MGRRLLRWRGAIHLISGRLPPSSSPATCWWTRRLWPRSVTRSRGPCRRQPVRSLVRNVPPGMRGHVWTSPTRRHGEPVWERRSRRASRCRSRRPARLHGSQPALLDHLADRATNDSYLAVSLDRPMSRPLTRLFLRMLLTPSNVTLLGVAIGLLGAVGLATVSVLGPAEWRPPAHRLPRARLRRPGPRPGAPGAEPHGRSPGPHRGRSGEPRGLWRAGHRTRARRTAAGWWLGGARARHRRGSRHGGGSHALHPPRAPS